MSLNTHDLRLEDSFGKMEGERKEPIVEFQNKTGRSSGISGSLTTVNGHVRRVEEVSRVRLTVDSFPSCGFLSGPLGVGSGSVLSDHKDCPEEDTETPVGRSPTRRN